ncbi:MAG: YgiQ family radical SAM protein [Anaerolineaceae bacterium]|nr:YgiQ family radical SAM protein [Anaerolineaceae bacterium]
MFLPTTRKEMQALGWDSLDVILISADSYIDSPYIGVALIGKLLAQRGYRVGIIAQPDIQNQADITRLGEPRLFWGVSGGSVDSMVANYTATNKRRRRDDYTPGGENDRRPNRAVIAYTNLIKRYFKNTCPIVLGGVEASLRRVAHYDYWSDSIRRSILFDAKADILVYGMAERTIVELAERLQKGQDWHDLRGLSYIAKEPHPDYLELPAYEAVRDDPQAFIEMFHRFYRNNDPLNARGLYQRHGDRVLVQNPPNFYLSQDEMDEVYALKFEHSQHPWYQAQGEVKALETIRFSLSTHRGCYGECNFCAIAVHEGRTVRWRSPDSIESEARRITKLPGFKGYIQDVSGPTANMYGYECPKKLKDGSCQDRRCLTPEICPVLKIDHSRQLSLLRRLRRIEGVKKVFVASGIRYDMVLADRQHGRTYLKEIVEHHTSGQLKIAPEHTEEHVLRRMGKPGTADLHQFKAMFDQMNKTAGKKQFLTYYLIAAYPGCSLADMQKLKTYASRELRLNPEQVQIFTPTPSTYASVMYHTGIDPFSGEKLFVEKDLAGKLRQKSVVTNKKHVHRPSSRRSKTRQRR